MFSCLQILEAFLWFVLITLLNVTLIILTLSVSRLDRKSGSAGMPRPTSYAVFCLKKKSELTWYFQTTTGDSFDFDATQPLVQADLTIGGRLHKVLLQAH